MTPKKKNVSKRDFLRFIRNVNCYCYLSKPFLNKDCWYCRKVKLKTTNLKKRIEEEIEKNKTVTQVFNVNKDYMRGRENAFEVIKKIMEEKL